MRDHLKNKLGVVETGPLWTARDIEQAKTVARAISGNTQEPDDATVEAYCQFMQLTQLMMQQAPSAGASFTIAGAMSLSIGSRIEGVRSRIEIEHAAQEYGKSCERLFKLFALGLARSDEPDTEKPTSA